MSNPITNLLTGGFSGIVESVSGILDHFITNPEEKLKAQLQLTQMANDLQVKVIEADRDFAVQQAAVITAEVKSESWIARNWRPILMLTFTYIIAHNYVLAPLFSFKSLPIPDQMWELLKLGISGYIVGRSVEKIAPDVAAIISKKQ
jgi:hypothetical protein